MVSGSIGAIRRIFSFRSIIDRFRQGPRKVEFEGGTFLRPTIVRCDTFAHPLANREFLFPYVSVTSVPQAQMLDKIGPSLAVTAITRDPAFIERLMDSLVAVEFEVRRE